MECRIRQRLCRRGPVPRREAVRIYSRHHLVVSVLVGALAAAVAGASPARTAAIVAYAGAVGVLLDLDHFPIARLNSGDWRALRYCLRRPAAVFLDQSSIFEPDEVGKLQRLASHALIGGGLVALLAAIRPSIAVLTAVVLYVHVLADLLSDLRDLDSPVGKPA